MDPTIPLLRVYEAYRSISTSLPEFVKPVKARIYITYYYLLLLLLIKAMRMELVGHVHGACTCSF